MYQILRTIGLLFASYIVRTTKLEKCDAGWSHDSLAGRASDPVQPRKRIAGTEVQNLPIEFDFSASQVPR